MFLTTAWFLFCTSLYGNPHPANSSAHIRLKLEKLAVLGNVLYVAAHPDDENTRLITYLAQERKLNTGYFSFTRGDGGQNLIGPEIGYNLGVIRTQELLAARRLDGGRQFFSRAVDFGYSKTAEETFAIWNRESVLADLVWVIRTFRPDVLINRFNTIPGTTHGHHTASAILTLEALEAAADPQRFPEQLEYTSVWKPKAAYWNTYYWARSGYERDTSELAVFNVGKYNTLLGMSYTEIAAMSRSMHKSQGFGAGGERGDVYDYLQFEKGDESLSRGFGNIDFSWRRVQGGASLVAEVDALLSRFNDERPAEIVPDLLSLRRKVLALNDPFWRETKLGEIDDLLVALTGLFLEARAVNHVVCPGDELSVTLELVNRSAVPMVLKGFSWNMGRADTLTHLSLPANRRQQITATLHIPGDARASQPYWLEQPGTVGLFHAEGQHLIGTPENSPPLHCRFDLLIGDELISIHRPLVHKRVDPVRGEVYRTVAISPPVYVHFDKSAFLFPDGNPMRVAIKIRAVKPGPAAELRLELPAGWRAEPERQTAGPFHNQEEETLYFTVYPSTVPGGGTGHILAVMEGKTYSSSVQEIAYDHIPAQLLFPGASAVFSRLELKVTAREIGYLMGAGDDMPASLEQMGCRVTLLNDLPFTEAVLDRFDAIVLGVRAYNTLQRLRAQNKALLEYVERGGTLIVQYNTNTNLVNPDFAPYPLSISRARVTEEDATVRLLVPDHRVFTYPNRIQPADFDGWVQERGLYFAGSWDPRYRALLACSDSGETALEGGILVAPHGKGHYIYTSLAWFRQLPASVPGAYRLFANLLSIGRDE